MPRTTIIVRTDREPTQGKAQLMMELLLEASPGVLGIAVVAPQPEPNVSAILTRGEF